MSVKYRAPEVLLTTTKCSICNNTLSVPPIMIISNDEHLYRCGRCVKGFRGTSFTRNFLYETLAQCVSFPCIYKNCLAEIPWSDVENHEKICRFRTIECPSCSLQVEILQLKTHFHEHHNETLKHGTVFTNLKAAGDFVGLIVVENLTFIIYILKYMEFFLFCVFSTEPGNKYTTYDVKLSSEKYNGFSVSYRSQKIIPYDTRSHCYNCITKTCQLSSHPFSQVYYNDEMDVKSFCVNSEQLMISLESPETMSCTIRLNKGSSAIKEVVEKFDREIRFHNNNNLLDHHLTCSICAQYMFPPIYSCTTGHSFCSVCKEMLRNCPSCKAEFTGTRNYELEAIAENVELSCQFKNQGCPFVGNTDRIRRHEIDCSNRI